MRETRCGTFELWSLPRSAASPADACGLPGAYGRRHNLCHGAIDPADGCLARGAGVQLHLAAVRCTDDRPHRPQTTRRGNAPISTIEKTGLKSLCAVCFSVILLPGKPALGSSRGSVRRSNRTLTCYALSGALRLRALPRALTTQLALTALPRLPRCGLRCAQANQLCPSAQTQAATTSRHKL